MKIVNQISVVKVQIQSNQKIKEKAGVHNNLKSCSN